jgi:RsiW-degrading membrane proteinase PrsW (M82 family)
VILYGTLALCALGAAFLVYRHDLYDREPAWLLLVTVGLGASSMNVAGLVETHALVWSGVTTRVGIAGLAALVEELAKLVVVVMVALCARKQFNDPLDGLVYGSMAGLGAAVEESVFYLRTEPLPAPVLPPVEAVRLCDHLIMGGIGGFALGMAVTGRKSWPLALVGGFGAATGLHFAWDWLSMSSTEEGVLGPGHTLSAVTLMLGGLVLYATLTSLGSGWSHALFAPDRPAILWGWPFKRTGRKI